MKNSNRPDFATAAGLVIAAAAVVAALRYEGIGLTEVVQPAAALIVFGGTLGAVLMSAPPQQVASALRDLRRVLWHRPDDPQQFAGSMAAWSRTARARGIVSLDRDARKIEDPVLRKAMCLAIDGFDAKSVRCAIDMEIRGIEHDAETSASFYEAAAGYAPTLAMVGAAIGLMNVMKHISDIGEAAAGIGAAFVATVYGVLLANLVLLPIASKIRASCQTRVRTCHAIAEGVLAVADGVNPAVLRARLEALLQLGEAPGEKENSEAVAAIRQQPAAQKGAAS